MDTIFKLLFVLFSLSFSSCDKYPDGIVEVENVTIDISNVYARRGEKISAKLVGNLTDFKSVKWEFGDGTTSDNIDNIKEYTIDGYYQINVTFETQTTPKTTKKIFVKVSGQSLTKALEDLRNNTSKIWVMSHRGKTENKSIPENSLSALEAAILAKADVIEIDTHITKDGVVMVCHDETINRTTNGSGRITEMTFQEVRSFKLLDINGRVTSEVMPTLKEILEAGRGRIFFNIDYSPRTASTQDVYRIVKETGMLDATFFYVGGKPEYVTELFSYNKNSHPYAWGGSVSNYEMLTKIDRDFFLQFDYTNYASQAINSAKLNGMLISYNVLDVNNFETPFLNGNYTIISQLIQSGAKMIQTDITNSLVSYLEKNNYR